MLGGVLVHGEAVLAHGEDGEEDAECGESGVLGITAVSRNG